MADSLVFANGDVLHGEVISLSRGTLNLDTDATDQISADWDDIVFVESLLFFEVTDADGILHYGRLAASDQPRVLLVMLEEVPIRVPFEEVVEIRILAKGFWAKTSGYVDASANLARANRLRSILLQLHTTYSGRTWAIDVDAESYVQSQTSDAGSESTESTEQRTSRTSATLSGRRFFTGAWALTTSVQTENNEELSLDRRTLFALGPRYNIIRSRGLELHTGVTTAVERYDSTPPESASKRDYQYGLTIGWMWG